jgi:L-threonylcarbamoyladenylate synthase
MPRILTIHPESPDDTRIREAADCLLDGGVIIYPTETLYGIGVHYSHEKALKRLFQIKNRDESKPVLLLIPDMSFLSTIALNPPPQAIVLAKHFWPGPLTLLLNAAPFHSTLLTGTDKKVGIRISSNVVVQRLMGFITSCITSTSANRSGGKNPLQISDIPAELLNAVDLVIDSGKSSGGIPSTVFDVSAEPFKIVRPGVISHEDILDVLKLQ